MKRIIVAAALLALGGCGLLPHYSELKALGEAGAKSAVDERKDFNDQRLSISLAAMCDNSIGSLSRLQDDDMRGAVMTICGMQGQGITIDRLADALTVLRQLDATKSQPAP